MSVPNNTELPGRYVHTWDEDETLIWERPVFMGESVPPFAADRPLPPLDPSILRVLNRQPIAGSGDPTVAERPEGKAA